MQAAPEATFPFLAPSTAIALYEQVVALAEEDETFGVFDSTEAREVSDKMVELFLDVEQIGIQDVEGRVNALFKAAIDELSMELYEGDADIVDARDKTQEGLRTAYRSITT